MMGQTTGHLEVDMPATGHCPVVVYVRRTHDRTLAHGVVQATGQTMRHTSLPVVMWFVITFLT